MRGKFDPYENDGTVVAVLSTWLQQALHCRIGNVDVSHYSHVGRYKENKKKRKKEHVYKEKE